MIDARLPPALRGRRIDIGGSGPRLCAYASKAAVRDPLVAQADTPPLLLVHSINASASAAEVRPLFERYGARRPTLALELPGFGCSQRGRLDYTPALMTASLLRAARHFRALGSAQPIDVLALSLSCEFVTAAVLEQPTWFRSVALVNPTGLESGRHERYDNGKTKDKPWLRRVLDAPVGEPLYRLLTTPASMRWFLERTWGSPAIDERLLEYARLTSRQHGARHAPAAFIGGALFTRGIAERYALMAPPVWLVHGVRGEFADFGGLSRIGPPAHWRCETFDTGAMPHLEAANLFVMRYDAFLEHVATGLSRSLPFSATRRADISSASTAVAREVSSWKAAPSSTVR